MDAREEGCFKTTPCHWYYVSTALHSTFGYETRLLPRSSYEPACITRLTHDNSFITPYYRALALPRP